MRAKQKHGAFFQRPIHLWRTLLVNSPSNTRRNIRFLEMKRQNSPIIHLKSAIADPNGQENTEHGAITARLLTGRARLWREFHQARKVNIFVTWFARRPLTFSAFFNCLNQPELGVRSARNGWIMVEKNRPVYVCKLFTMAWLIYESRCL